MTKDLLTAAGIPAKRARFADPPATTYAVYFDDVDAGGADNIDLVHTHDVSVELYAPKLTAATAAENALEVQLRAAGLTWAKQAAYWLDDVQRYQVVYEFTYYEKRRAV